MRGTDLRKFGGVVACGAMLLGGPAASGGDAAGVGVTAAARAADAALRAPVLGYVAAGSPPALRPILGFPGAAALGGALEIQPEPALLAVPPGQALVLIGRGPSKGLAYAQIGAAGLGAETEIEGAVEGADRAVFSPSGASAVVSSAQAGRLQVLTGFPAEPHVAYEIDASGFAANVRSLAVSDDGSFVLAGISDGVTGAVRLYAKDRDPVPLLQAGNPAVVRLSEDSARAVVVDTALDQVTVLEGFGSEVRARVFPAAADGEGAGPDDALLPAGGKRLCILFASRNEARIVDLDNGVMARTSFGGGAVDAGRLAQSGLTVRTSADGRSVWLVDFSAAEPQSRYVPTLPAAADGNAQEVVK